jgi:hypothetical protein
MSGNQILGGIIAVLFLVLLVTWGKFSGSIDTTWKDTALPCLPSGHVGLKQQNQLQLVVTLDGATEVVPGDIGVSPDCMAETHTHDTTGRVHLESLNPEKRFTLGDFFTVWGIPLERSRQ